MYIRYGNTESNRDMRDLSLPPSLSPFFSLAKRNGPERRDSRETQIHTLSSLALHGGEGGGKVSLCLLACLCCDDIDMGSSETQNDILN